MKVLIDTNVILDVLLKQEPFYKDSFVIFQLADNGNIKGILAAISLTNVFFLLRKARKNADEVYQIMDNLTSLFSIAPINEKSISNALSLRWKDFEDAVQYMTAKESNVDYIITRNEIDFKNSDIPYMTPTDFISFLKNKEL